MNGIKHDICKKKLQEPFFSLEDDFFNFSDDVRNMHVFEFHVLKKKKYRKETCYLQTI